MQTRRGISHVARTPDAPRPAPCPAPCNPTSAAAADCSSRLLNNPVVALPTARVRHPQTTDQHLRTPAPNHATCIPVSLPFNTRLKVCYQRVRVADVVMCLRKLFACALSIKLHRWVAMAAVPASHAAATAPSLAPWEPPCSRAPGGLVIPQSVRGQRWIARLHEHAYFGKE